MRSRHPNAPVVDEAALAHRRAGAPTAGIDRGQPTRNQGLAADGVRCGCCRAKCAIIDGVVAWSCICPEVERTCHPCARKVCHCRCKKRDV